MSTYNDAAMNRLIDYLIQVQSREPELLDNFEPGRVCTVEALLEDDVLIVENDAQARMCRLLSEAFLMMSADNHDEDDRAVLYQNQVCSPARAVVLVKEHKGLRPAARATGIDVWLLHRAYQKAKGLCLV